MRSCFHTAGVAFPSQNVLVTFTLHIHPAVPRLDAMRLFSQSFCGTSTMVLYCYTTSILEVGRMATRHLSDRCDQNERTPQETANTHSRTKPGPKQIDRIHIFVTTGQSQAEPSMIVHLEDLSPLLQTHCSFTAAQQFSSLMRPGIKLAQHQCTLKTSRAGKLAKRRLHEPRIYFI